jgi:hypothetical protein
MGKQTFTAGQVLTAAEMNSLQENDYNWTVTTKTASYTLAAGDEGTRIVMNNAGATTITVDDAVFSAGDVVWVHNIGAGTCTVTAGTATVNTAGSLELAQWGGGALYFTSASTAIFFPAGGGVSSVEFDIEYLVIAGGGSGGPQSAGGGGGAGGYRCSFGTDPSGGGGSTETPLTATVPGTLLVVVGAGGTFGAYTQAPSSTLGYRGASPTSITSVGGGYGPGYNQNGTVGGSGSGAHPPDGTTVRTGGAGTANQGYAGGNSTNVSGWGVGGGGGGSGGAATGPEDGGAGLASSITGSSVTRAGGGGGGQDSRGGTSRRGVGAAGGGNGGGTGTSATANSGSGGGGSGYPSGGGGNGGSGIVIIRFPNTIDDPTIGPGLTYSSSTDGSDKIIQFTAGTDTVVWS